MSQSESRIMGQKRRNSQSGNGANCTELKLLTTLELNAHFKEFLQGCFVLM